VERRARAYLHANCAHCHNEADTSMARLTGLHLDIDESDPVGLGCCRRPNSAGNGTGGRSFDLVSGDPEMSILVWRMRSTDPALRMPQLPNNFVDEAAGRAGVAVDPRDARVALFDAVRLDGGRCCVLGSGTKNQDSLSVAAEV
jgi:hypothetical protein